MEILVEYNKENLNRIFGDFFKSFIINHFDELKKDYYIIFDKEINPENAFYDFLARIEFEFDRHKKNYLINEDLTKVIKDSYFIYFISKVKQELEKINSLKDIEFLNRFFVIITQTFDLAELVMLVSYIKENKIQNKLNNQEHEEIKNLINNYFSMSFNELFNAYEKIVKPNQKVFYDIIYRYKVKSLLKLIYQDEKIKIYRTDTYFECRALGADTRWCTASSSGESHFKHYSSHSYLYVIFIGDDKYHLSIPKFIEEFLSTKDPVKTVLAYLNMGDSAMNVFDMFHSFNMYLYDSYYTNYENARHSLHEEETIVKLYTNFISEMNNFDIFKKNKIKSNKVKISNTLNKGLLFTMFLEISELRDSQNDYVSYKTIYEDLQGVKTKDEVFNLFLDLVNVYLDEKYKKIFITNENYIEAFDIMDKVVAALKKSESEGLILSFLNKVKQIYQYLDYFDNLKEEEDSESVKHKIQSFEKLLKVLGKNQEEKIEKDLKNIANNLIIKEWSKENLIVLFSLDSNKINNLIEKYRFSVFLSEFFKTLLEIKENTTKSFNKLGTFNFGDYDVNVFRLENQHYLPNEFRSWVMNNNYYENLILNVKKEGEVSSENVSIQILKSYFDITQSDLNSLVYNVSSIVFIKFLDSHFSDDVLEIFKQIKKYYKSLVNTLSKENIIYPEEITENNYYDVLKNIIGIDLFGLFSYERYLIDNNYILKHVLLVIQLIRLFRNETLPSEDKLDKLNEYFRFGSLDMYERVLSVKPVLVISDIGKKTRYEIALKTLETFKSRNQLYEKAGVLLDFFIRECKIYEAIPTKVYPALVLNKNNVEATVKNVITYLIKNQSSVINSTTDLEYKNIINNKLPEIEEYLLDYSDYVLKDYVYSKMGLFMSIFQLLYEKKPNLYKEMMNRIEEALSRAKEVTDTFDFPFDHIADKPSVFVNDYKRLVNKYLKK